MKIVTSLDQFEGALPYPVFTIGNFDGLHIGHQEIIKRVIQRARANCGTSGVLTFDPHPIKILAPTTEFHQIQTLDQKVSVLKGLGIDVVVIVPFTHDLAQCSATDFATEIIGAKLKVKELFVGTGFAFGKDRQGNVELLEQIGAERGFKVGRVNEVLFRNKKVSSRFIRTLLFDGRMSYARRLLNRYYSIEGNIVRGQQIGSEIGFPTANILSENPIIPKFGVYVTYFFLKGQRYRSVTNVGLRPTFTSGIENPQPTIETFVFGIDIELYGQKIALSFCTRLRDEKKFDSKESLVQQIKRDIVLANRYFNVVERREVR